VGRYPDFRYGWREPSVISPSKKVCSTVTLHGASQTPIRGAGAPCATRAAGSPVRNNGYVTVPFMAERQRRPRGLTKDWPFVHGKVRPDAKAIVAHAADTLHVTEARVIEAILLALTLDERGVPSIIADEFHREEELQLPAA